jgi:hypothetical protein
MAEKSTNGRSVHKSGKATGSALSQKSVTRLKEAGSWESARIAGKYLKRPK